MKRIEKGLSPAQFEEWKARANAEWTPTYEGLQKPQKAAVHCALLAEQGFVCCYCGRRIDANDSHIEHFQPREHYPALALEYENLHASCIRETLPGTPLHCGHAKGSQFDEATVISPLETGCERRFVYTKYGEIKVRDTEDHCAHCMIELLQLNNTALVARRRDTLNRVFDVELTNAELARVTAVFTLRDNDGRFPNFGHVIACFATQMAGQT